MPRRGETDVLYERETMCMCILLYSRMGKDLGTFVRRFSRLQTFLKRCSPYLIYASV